MNIQSMNFHLKYGFSEIGRKNTETEKKGSHICLSKFNKHNFNLQRL